MIQHVKCDYAVMPYILGSNFS